MHGRIILLLVAATLAGCAGSDSNDDEFPDLGGEVTDSTGLIRGVVVDAFINPIEGALIVVGGTDKETTSNADGAFVIDGLDPDSYILSISRAGYSPVQSSTNVEAGVAKPPLVRVQMTAIEVIPPTATTLKFEGHITCTFTGVFVTFAACGADSATGDRFLSRFDVLDYPDHIQAELQWTSTQQTGAGLQLWVYDDTTSAPLKDVGTSPLVISEPRDFWENGTGGAKEGSSAFIEPGTQFGFRVFADGADGSNQCELGIPFCVGGAGMAVDQPYELWVTIFERMSPDEGWMFVNDGEHPIE